MRKTTLVLALLCVLSSSVWADNPQPITKPTRVGSATTCTTAGGSTLLLVKGDLVVPGPSWAALDTELRALQTLKIRLTTENTSFRASLSKRPIPWYYISAALSLGYGAGYLWKAVR